MLIQGKIGGDTGFWMDIRTQSTLLAAIVGLALGLSMLLRGGRARVLTLYSFFALNVGGYYFAQFFLSLFSPATRFPWLLRIVVGFLGLDRRVTAMPAR